jgi:hypothetical protein
VRPDTESYLIVARRGLGDSLWYRGLNRPFTMPLALKAVGCNLTSLAVLQRLASCASWLLLGLSVGLFLEGQAFRWLAVGLFGAFGQIAYVEQWDHVALSESLSFSCTAAWLGSSLIAIRTMQHPSRRTTLALAANGLLLLAVLFARESNFTFAALALPILLGLGGSSLRRGDRKRCAIYAGLLIFYLAALIAGMLHMAKSERWKMPLANVVLVRILPDTATRAEFTRQHGLPVSDDLLRLQGRFAYDCREEMPPEFWSWIEERGMREYRRWLLGSLIPRFAEAWRAWSRAPNALTYVDDQGWSIRTRLLTKFLFPHVRGAEALFAVAVILSLVSARGMFRNFRAKADHLPDSKSPASVLGVLSLFLLGNVAAQVFVCYHGDAMSVERHLIMAPILLRLALWMALVGLCDEWLGGFYAPAR